MFQRNFCHSMYKTSVNYFRPERRTEHKQVFRNPMVGTYSDTKSVMVWSDWIFCKERSLTRGSAVCLHLTSLVTGSKPVYCCITNSMRGPVCFLGCLEITSVMIWLNNDMLIFEVHCVNSLFFKRIRVSSKGPSQKNTAWCADCLRRLEP